MNTHLQTHLEPLPRGIIIAATPLGNIHDASPRLRQALAEANVIAAEDTRRTRNLASALGVEITGRVVSNFDHNEQSRITQLLEAATSGTVVIVTDAGMPSVSDPGFALIDAAHAQGVPVTCFPGPSAVPTALALSGLPVGRFCFEGFAPRKDGARRGWLESLRSEQRAVCFFESPHRLVDTLEQAVEILGPNRRAAIARELTKMFEEVRRGSLAELLVWARDGVKGEITVVLEGATGPVVDIESLLFEVADRVAAGERLKAVCSELAARHGVSKKELYDAYVAARY
ncbi:16S rRNA (cytidine(1402)-2'-O)-methyltransferase [Corynebacterium freiburgense]|uniref:16S rRNA (cytidine(1402)-2'-O)-methyltransferase n=1 Tax=Corynebacterium freiburgense TaxID=556548 RepID=UPI00041F1A45|nr:16S rRNA (cytidine(1402)-2'-O)-methyltransferase [Corynebacterium freiburgense]WJZ02114.1 Ribosomal RNA small subunit methyltransferase I [Corynebacterium freiburgense]